MIVVERRTKKEVMAETEDRAIHLRRDGSSISSILSVIPT